MKVLSKLEVSFFDKDEKNIKFEQLLSLFLLFYKIVSKLQHLS